MGQCSPLKQLAHLRVAATTSTERDSSGDEADPDDKTHRTDEMRIETMAGERHVGGAAFLVKR